MSHASPFTDLAAVEGWDTWFRWRSVGVLRDVSIHDTWARVVRAIARPGSRADDKLREQRMLDAMEAWRLLPDERILSTAGTGQERWPDNELVAVLNVARFVGNPGLPTAYIDLTAIEATAGLAVEMLDNAAENAPGSLGQPGRHLRIGLMGLADAFLLLDITYGSPLACRIAHDVSRHLASGCLDSSLRLARDRGPRCRISRDLPVAYKLRELSPALADDAARHGLRQARLTAITSQPRLAQFADNVTNAVDPPALAQPPGATAEPESWRRSGSPGYAVEWLRRHGASPSRIRELLALANVSTHAQIALRTSMQMWVDEPILYALSDQPDDHAAIEAGLSNH